MDKKLIFYILKRLLLAFVTVVIVITVTFFAMQLIPGGPFTSEKAVSPETLERLQAKYGLDQPIIVQYFRYLQSALVFDFGYSIKSRGARKVMDLIIAGFRFSSATGLIAASIAIVFGILLGSLAAYKHNTWVDKTIMVFSTASVAVPSFVISLSFYICFVLSGKSCQPIVAHGKDLSFQPSHYPSPQWLILYD